MKVENIHLFEEKCGQYGQFSSTDSVVDYLK